MAEDPGIAEEILNCELALESKRLGYKISGFDMKKWSTDGYAVCQEGIKCKFMQNPLLLQMLKSTGNKTIIEASMDKLGELGLDYMTTKP